VHSGYTPRRFIFEKGIMYFIDRDSGNLFAFREGKRTDGSALINQRIDSKDIDLSQPFLKKDIVQIVLLLENLNQDLFLNLYAGNNGRYQTIRRNIKIRKVINSKPYLGASDTD